MRRVAVIGAGWAGLSAAVRLVQAGCHVELFEAAAQAGGRARSVRLGESEFDNGQHLIIGAYRETLTLLREVGVPAAMLPRSPLTLLGPGAFSCKAPRLPAPLHLLVAIARAQGLSIGERAALVRWMLVQRLRGFRVDRRLTVAQWTTPLPPRVRALLLDPLCLAALNTAPDRADASVFATVLRDSLTRKQSDSDFIFPQDALGRLLPEHGVAWLHRHRALVHVRSPIRTIARRVDAGGAVTWALDDHPKGFDALVLATPAAVTARWLEQLADDGLTTTIGMLRSLHYAPITTVYLLPESAVMLASAMMALEFDPTRQWYGQYLFDRSQTGGPWGWLAIVISDSGDVMSLPRDALIEACRRQLEHALGQAISVAEAHVITDKRATYACTPGLNRPPTTLAVPGLYLAGDYTEGNYPATLEQAVISGAQAAAAIGSR